MIRTLVYLQILCLFIIISCSEDAPIIIELGNPSIEEVFDIDNQNNASDIRIFINQAGNSEFVGEYRVFLVNSNEAVSFNVAQAEGIPASSFQTVPASIGQIRLNLSAALTDINNNPVINGSSPTVIVLAVGNDSNIASVLSAPSDPFQLANESLFDIYTSSRDGNSVELFDGVTGEHIRSFVAGGTGGLSRTQEVLFGSDGDLYVSGRDNAAILRFDGQTGVLKGNFTSGYDLDEPTKMNFGPNGDLYVSQWGQIKDAVVRFNGTTGEFIDEIVPSYFQGMDQAWDDDDNLYVTSWGLATVIKYDKDGNFLSTLISNNLNGPVNMWVIGNDLFVVDWTDGQVKIFDKNDGSLKSTFITGFNRVEGFVFDQNGDLLLCDWADDIVKKYNATTGQIIKVLINDARLATPNSITIGPNHRPGN